jgi:TPR repeat protein
MRERFAEGEPHLMGVAFARSACARRHDRGRHGCFRSSALYALDLGPSCAARSSVRQLRKSISVTCARTGWGRLRIFSTTVKWLRRAADQGYPAAQFLVGLMYDKGHGVRQDFIEAEVWPDLAASRALEWTLIQER